MSTPKPQAILEYLRDHETITKKEAVVLIGGSYYCNAAFHVGNVLSRMVKSRLIARIKPGLYGHTEKASKVIAWEGEELFK
jgi:hypothetical protein